MKTIRFACALALLAALPVVVHAQEEPQGASATLSVSVVDQATRSPLPSAAVVFPELGRQGATNAQGQSVFLDFPAGTHTLVVRLIGFEEFQTRVTVEGGGMENVTITMGANPVVLEGVSVHGYTFASQLERRRLSTATSVRVIDRPSLSNTGAGDARQFIAVYGGLMRTSCPGGGLGQCIVIRGRAGRPSIVIDERPAVGGLDELALYRPQELYAVEIFGGGRQIRAYTLDFIERRGQLGNRAIFPIMTF